jgi:hypothetical protein
MSQRILKFSDLLHHREGVLILRLHLDPELFVLITDTLELLAQLQNLFAAAVPALALHARLLALVVVGRVRGIRLGAGAFHIRVNAAKVLIKVLLSREALACMTLAIRMGALDCVLGSAVFAVDFAFVSKKATRVCEPGEALASGDNAPIWAFVLVHMFTNIMLVTD